MRSDSTRIFSPMRAIDLRSYGTTRLAEIIHKPGYDLPHHKEARAGLNGERGAGSDSTRIFSPMRVIDLRSYGTTRPAKIIHKPGYDLLHHKETRAGLDGGRGAGLEGGAKVMLRAVSIKASRAVVVGACIAGLGAE